MNKKIILSILLPFILLAAIIIGFLLGYPNEKPIQNIQQSEPVISDSQTFEDTPFSNTNTSVINNDTNAVEYNGKIYFNNYTINNPYSNVTVCQIDSDGKNKKTLLQNEVYETVHIYNDTLYTEEQHLKLSEKLPIENKLPIEYIDDKITIYKDELNSKNYVFNTPANIYGKDTAILTFDGEFIERIDNKIYFYKNGSTETYLFSSDILTKEVFSVDTTKFTDIFEDYEDGYYEYYFIISDIECVNNTILYCIGCYQGSGNYWYGDIIKVNTDGSSKKIIEKYSGSNSLYRDDKNIYYGVGNFSTWDWMLYEDGLSPENKFYAYSTASDTLINLNGNLENILNLTSEYKVTKTNDGIYLMKLNSDKTTYSKDIKITSKNENFSRLEDIVIFDDYIIAYLEYRDYNDSGWRGIPSMYVYYIKKDGSQITLLNN